MPWALDIVREVALLETYALPLERADESGKCRGSFQSKVAGITR
jgi:hypothetical protein